MSKLRVFISSVYLELKEEREFAQSLITSDPALSEYFTPLLLENITAGQSVKKEIDSLIASSDVFVILLGERTGANLNGKSYLEYEYTEARSLGKRILFFAKDIGREREKTAQSLLDDAAQRTRINLYSTLGEFRLALIKALRSIAAEYTPHLSTTLPTVKAIEKSMGKASQAEDASTPFKMTDLDLDLAKQMVARWYDEDPRKIKKQLLGKRLATLGHVKADRRGEMKATLAGAVVLGNNPSNAKGLHNFHISAEAYAGKDATSKVNDTCLIAGSAPEMIRGAIDFVSKNTRHPERIFAERSYRLDEYPEEAIREAVVNAIAHRDYDETAGRIILRVFSDRVAVLSPGKPPDPLTPAALSKGGAKPISRNQLIAQSLFRLDLMEHRGSGYTKLRGMIGKTGLKNIDVAMSDGYLELTLYGPGEKIDELPLPPVIIDQFVAKSKAAPLNERQRKMMEQLLAGETLTSSDSMKVYGVSRDTTASDFKTLVATGIAEKVGGGRSTRYVLAGLTPA